MKTISILILIVLLAAWFALGTVAFMLLFVGLLFGVISLLPLVQARVAR